MCRGGVLTGKFYPNTFLKNRFLPGAVFYCIKVIYFFSIISYLKEEVAFVGDFKKENIRNVKVNPFYSYLLCIVKDII